MTPLANRRIKRRPVPDLQADRATYQLILEDMVRNGGPLVPDPNWLRTEDTSKAPENYDRGAALEFALSEEHYRTKVASMRNLMRAWTGGAQRPSPRTISKYCQFLKHCDLLDLWAANIGGAASDAIALSDPDLGTLMDLNLLYAFVPSPSSDKSTVLEVGGGYGRLAEAMFNVFGRSVQYVLVDAVPASLYYAPKYLCTAVPDARVGSYYDSEGEGFEIGRYDIAIVPAWHFERLNTLRYDICVNIESMQEMNQNHVDYYLKLFDAVATENAAIYLSNAHGYYFRGSFNYPPSWQRLFCGNTPRSWSADHPTEIFRKTTESHTDPNSALDALHRYRIWLERDVQEFVDHSAAKQWIRPLLKKIFGALASRTRNVVRGISR